MPTFIAILYRIRCAGLDGRVGALVLRCGAVVLTAALCLNFAVAQQTPYNGPIDYQQPAAPVIIQQPQLVEESDGARSYELQWRLGDDNQAHSVYLWNFLLKAVSMDGNNPADCDSVFEATPLSQLTILEENNGFINQRATVSAIAFTVSGSAPQCLQGEIYLCKTGGCGGIARTSRFLDSPADASCPAGQSRDLFNQCVGNESLEGADWCWRAGNALSFSTRKSYDANQTFGGAEYDFSCAAETRFSWDCSGRGQPLDKGGGEDACPIGPGSPSLCGNLAEYDPLHRECQCVGLAEGMHEDTEISGARSLSCACNVKGADPETCQCPQGSAFYFDRNECGNPVAEVHFAASGETLSSNQKSTLEFTIRHEEIPNFGKLNIFLGESEIPLPGCENLNLSPATAATILTASCQTYLPPGTHNIWAEYKLQCHNTSACDWTYVPEEGEPMWENYRLLCLIPECRVRREDRSHLRVNVGGAFQRQCENPNRAANPAGGEYKRDYLWDVCLVRRSAYYHLAGNDIPECQQFVGGTRNGCDDLFRNLRQTGCMERGLLFKSIDDFSCVCPAGRNAGAPPEAGDVCPSGRDEDLIAETMKERPVLASVVALLNEGVNPNITTAAGVPLLIVAATMLHAEVVSVLITAGADPNVRLEIPHPHYSGTVLRSIPEALAQWIYKGTLPADQQALEMFFHFGDAARNFDWLESANYAGPANSIGAGILAMLAGRQRGRPLDPFLVEIGGYVLDRGATCPNSFLAPNNTFYAMHNSPICTSRRACPSNFNHAQRACGECDGFPFRAVIGASCVSRCGAGQVAEETAWGDMQCKCINSESMDEFGCASEHDAALIAEVQKTAPVLSSVRLLLEKGARPNILTDDGVPLLFVAATMWHPEVVSVLITAGADPKTRFTLRVEYANDEAERRTVPALLAELAAFAGVNGQFMNQRRAEVFTHFAKAAADRFNWRAAETPHFTVGEYVIGALGRRHEEITELNKDIGESNTIQKELAFLVAIGGLMLDQGANCPSAFFFPNTPVSDYRGSAVCLARVACDIAPGGRVYDCGGGQCGAKILLNHQSECVAQCALNQYLDDSVWPHKRCRCTSGQPTNGYGQCPGPLDFLLAEEIQKTEPVLSSIVALLEDGANPNYISNGAPALILAAELARGKIISVLIAAGGDPGARREGVRENIPSILMNDISRPARQNAEALIDFGGAVDSAAAASALFPGFADSPDFWGGAIIRAALEGMGARHDKATDEDKRAFEVMSAYLQNRGLDCARVLGGDHPLCDARRTCPATGELMHSCGACAGNTLREREGNSCVSQCGVDEVAETAGFPDNQCQCAHGAPGAFGCPRAPDAELLEEALKPSPNLSTIRFWLDRGASPNIGLEDGTPLIFAAATLNHAEVVSVLITAGVHPETKRRVGDSEIYLSLPEQVIRADGGEKARVIMHFAGAVQVAAATSTVNFNWSDSAFSNAAFDALRQAHNESADSELREELQFIGGYLRDLGAECPAAHSGEAVCVSRRACPSSAASVSSCSVCAENPLRSLDGASCASECGRNESISAPASWGEKQCQCKSGATLSMSGQCGVPADFALVAEIQKAEPITAVVFALLDDGAGPDFAAESGAPPLVVAATLGHSEIISILITAGADPEIRANIPGFLGMHSVPDFVGYAADQERFNGGQNVSPRRTAESFARFIDALDVAEKSFGWKNAGSALFHQSLSSAFAGADDAGRAVISEMVLRGAELGVGCPAGDFLCRSIAPPVCPDGNDRWSCKFCAQNPFHSLDGASCLQSCGANQRLAGVDEIPRLSPGCVCEDGFTRIGGMCAPDSPPDSPWNVRLQLSGAWGAPAVSLTWSAPDNGPDIPPLLDFVVWKKSTVAASCEEADLTGGEYAQGEGASLTMRLDMAAADISSLESSVSYGECVLYAVAAKDARGMSEAAESNAVYARHPPGPPQAPTATLTAENAVSLSWSAEVDARGTRVSVFEVLREVDGSEKFMLAGGESADGADRISFADFAAPTGVTLRYKVRATGGGTRGELSESSAPLFVPGESADYDATLAAEMRLANPRLMSVVFYLQSGADADLQVDGAPALIVAATLGRADLMSVFADAGAELSAVHSGKMHRNAAHFLTHNGGGLSWEVARRALQFLALAAAERELESGASAFDWNAEDDSGWRALEFLRGHHQGASAEDKTTLERIANALLARGAACAADFAGIDYVTCAGSPGPTVSFFSVSLFGRGVRASLRWAGGAGVLPVAGYSAWRTQAEAATADCADAAFSPVEMTARPLATLSAQSTLLVDDIGIGGYGMCHKWALAAVSDGGKFGALAESEALYSQDAPMTMLAPDAALDDDGIPLIKWTRLTSRIRERRGAIIAGYEVGRAVADAQAEWVVIATAFAGDSSYLDADAAASVSYYYRVRALNADLNVGHGGYSEGSGVLTVPEAPPCDSAEFAVIGGKCVSRAGPVRLRRGAGMTELEEMRVICADAFGGDVDGAEKRVCSGIDQNDTFCIMDSREAFPCGGLFKHIRACNLLFNRKALNPFFCGEQCNSAAASGKECI